MLCFIMMIDHEENLLSGRDSENCRVTWQTFCFGRRLSCLCSAGAALIRWVLLTKQTNLSWLAWWRLKLDVDWSDSNPWFRPDETKEIVCDGGALHKGFNPSKDRTLNHWVEQLQWFPVPRVQNPKGSGRNGISESHVKPRARPSEYLCPATWAQSLGGKMWTVDMFGDLEKWYNT